MNARVVLRPQVPDDLHAIVQYLEQHSGTVVANRFADNVFATLDGLAAHPGRGSPKQLRSRQLVGVRTCAVAGFRNHLIFYRHEADAVVVLAVVHGSRNVRALLLDRLRPPG
ncbi:MAG TPA: type II toxin-antitoxin system RelE/ParE family toxin [Tepidisphaeraceae bacterium]|nr:type II toxin-antitoxin system RelE/ParE family toxin [Tepidisphaeraceae bacterium]